MTDKAENTEPAFKPPAPDELRRRIARTLDDSTEQELQDGVYPKKCGIGAFTSTEGDEETPQRRR
ncbi:MAG: hypothetical protein ABIJ09_16580 [Pseudomonadota bacterium]